VGFEDPLGALPLKNHSCGAEESLDGLWLSLLSTWLQTTLIEVAVEIAAVAAFKAARKHLQC